jgi:hypothetical protein
MITMAKRRSQGGMVTAELAVAISAAVIVMIILCWGICLLVLQLRLVDTAGAVARQAARGDRAGVARAEASAPKGTAIRVEQGKSMTRVTLRLQADPYGPLMPTVRLGAVAEIGTEPGVGR